jgi:hypothetical protein
VRRELVEAELLAPEPREDLLALDEALTLLATTDRTAADLVQLRYFGGLSVADAARVLGLSVRSAERIWTYTRVWLLAFEMMMKIFARTATRLGASAARNRVPAVPCSPVTPAADCRARSLQTAGSTRSSGAAPLRVSREVAR